mmetsp:Transcript_21504/g.26488  ORF Transcript_21504/g.26488 Transcript_21504/m.26488 type:complete len:85 (+) Transcript_21504:802-1056(+)
MLVIKKIRNVIGSNSVLSKALGYKKHLILLQLMKFARRDGDDLLVVTNYKDDCHHFKRINLCETYQVLTNGMISADMAKIITKI